MNRSDKDAASSRRRRLIENLNAKEAQLATSRGEGPRLSEKEIEIEKVRQFNFSRRGFSQMF